MKRIFAILMAVAMMMSIAGAFAEGVYPANLVENPEWWVKYDTEVPMSTNYSYSGLMIEQIPEGYALDDNTYFDWIKDVFNVDMQMKWNAEDTTTKLNLAMASNDLPDIIHCSGTDLATLVNGNSIQPIDDLVDEYASPLVKYLLGQFQEATGGSFLSAYTYGGHAYGIPTLADVWATTSGATYIRKDIVEELGYELPTSIEELEEIYAAYKEAYPEGTAIALSSGDTGLGGIETAMYAAGAYPYKWVETEDGSLVYGSVAPEAKTGLEILAKWYQNGWIDKEFATNSSLNGQKFAAGDVLSEVAMWHIVWGDARNLAMNNPDAFVYALDPLTYEGNGGLWCTSNAFSVGASCIAVSSACEHPEFLIYLTNLAWDSQFRNNLEIRELMEKEYGYTFVHPVTEVLDPINPEAAPGGQIRPYSKEVGGPGYFDGWGGYEVHIPYNQGAYELVGQYKRIMENDAAGVELTKVDADERAKYSDVSENNWLCLTTNVTMFYKMVEEGRLITDKFASSATPTAVEKGAYLSKLEAQAYVQIITGEKPLDYFDEFVNEWYTAGGEDWTEEVNAWYETTK